MPYLADHCLVPCDPEFPSRAKENGGGVIVAGTNYGQGSSREHAALAPLYLGVRAVVAKSFARIHRQNLINNGIVPLVFKNEADYDTIDLLDELEVVNVKGQISGSSLVLVNKTKGLEYDMEIDLTERQQNMLEAGGLLNLMKESNK